MPDDIAVAERFIKERVAQELSNVGLGSWKVLPEPYVGDLPVVTFVMIGCEDVDVADSGDSLLSYSLFRVVARASGRTLSATKTAAQAIHAALNRVQTSNADGEVFWSRRERSIRLTIPHGQEAETLHGGEYRISVKGA